MKYENLFTRLENSKENLRSRMNQAEGTLSGHKHEVEDRH